MNTVFFPTSSRVVFQGTLEAEWLGALSNLIMYGFRTAEHQHMINVPQNIFGVFGLCYWPHPSTHCCSWPWPSQSCKATSQPTFAFWKIRYCSAGGVAIGMKSASRLGHKSILLQKRDRRDFVSFRRPQFELSPLLLLLPIISNFTISI